MTFRSARSPLRATSLSHLPFHTSVEESRKAGTRPGNFISAAVYHLAHFGARPKSNREPSQPGRPYRKGEEKENTIFALSSLRIQGPSLTREGWVTAAGKPKLAS